MEQNTIESMESQYDQFVPEIDEDTGEELPSAPFEIDSEEKVVWYTKKLSDYAAQVAALRMQQVSMNDHFNRKIAGIERKSNVFETRFIEPVRKWALENLPRGKKTVETPFAKLSFRSKKAKLVLEDADAAIQYLNAWAEGKGVEKEIKYKVLLTQIPKDTYAGLLSDAELAKTAGFTIDPEAEEFKVKPLSEPE